MKTIFAVALCLLVAGAYAQSKTVPDAAMVTIQFDNRGQKVMSADTEKKILSALAKHVFNVPTGSVVRSTGMGQSSLTNHQSVVTYTAKGPTTNGKTVLLNCQTNTKGNLFVGSNAAKEIKKATDTWAVGDSVKLQSAVCAPLAVGGAGKTPNNNVKLAPGAGSTPPVKKVAHSAGRRLL